MGLKDWKTSAAEKVEKIPPYGNSVTADAIPDRIEKPLLDLGYVLYGIGWFVAMNAVPALLSLLWVVGLSFGGGYLTMHALGHEVGFIPGAIVGVLVARLTAEQSREGL